MAEGESVSLRRPGVASVRERGLEIVFGVVTAAFVLDLIRKLVTGGVQASTVATFLWQGFVFGMAIGLAGVGLAMTYSILQFANFAHGDMITAGGFAGWIGAFLVAGIGEVALEVLVLVGEPASISSELAISVTNTPVAILIGFLLAVVATPVLSLLIDRIVFRPMRDQSGVALLIASVGVALALRHLIQFVFQPTTPPVTFGGGIRSVSVPIGAESVVVGAHQVTLVVVSILLMIGVHILLQRTKLGTAMRAMADNEDLARVSGIPTERVVFYTWVIGGGLTGAAGFLLALEQGFLSLTLGWDLLLLIFAAVILGGIGSVYGAIAGGLVIGIVSQMSLVWFPSEFTQVAAFVIMIAVLLIRPSGLFGGVTSV
jgi:branched-chain amino acid transport system permease protein